MQRISDALAVRIYEAAARAALEHNDLPEYSQCQARLMALHRAGVRGCREEFLAYRILYQLAHSRSGGLAALTSTLRQVTDKVCLCAQSRPVPILGETPCMGCLGP